MLTEKQKTILEFAWKNDNKVTKSDAMKLINTHFYNGDKHVGESLSRMVRAGLLVRVKPGYFEIGKGTRIKPTTIIDNQPNLF